MSEGIENRPKSATVWPLLALWPFMRPHGRMAAGALLALLAAAGLTLAVPLSMRGVVDGFAEGRIDAIDGAFLALMGLACLLAVFTAARFYFVTRLGERVVADIRRAVYAHLIDMSPGFFERIQTGETLSRLTTDTTVIQSVVGSSASVALRNLLVLIGGAAMLFATSPKLTGVVLLGAPAVVAPVILLGRRVRRLSRLSQDKVADSSAFAGETLQATQTVQAFSYEPEARRRFETAVEEAYRAALDRVAWRAVLTAVAIVIGFAAVVGALWLGARDVVENRMSPGELAQFVLLALFVAGAVAALSEVWGELQRAAGATERLLELLAARSEIAPPAVPTAPTAPATGAVSVQDVSFRYPLRPNAPALSGISFEARSGETVALVGPSGSGKTTLFQLLLRFRDPDAGRICVDGVDVRDMAPAQLRRLFAFVPQEPAIFATSVAANIRVGDPSASDAQVRAAAEAAAAHAFIDALPEGYDTQVGERGVTLSGGQRQRLAVARAILRDAPILLLDEATSALDAESERLVQGAIERLSSDRTTLVIAHRLATVRRADRILVLDGGRLAAEGAHDALIAQGGLYSRLARLQFAA